MAELECNMFKDGWDRDCTTVVPVIRILNNIKKGRWKDKIEEIRENRDKGEKINVDKLKFRLPSATFSGVFEERKDEHILQYNKLMIIDIDDIAKRRVKTLKVELKNNPWIFSFFDGPTKGLKVLVFVSSEQDEHIYAFEYIESLFLELYGIKIDKSGKNLSRLCFMSYDPELYINPNPHELQVVIKRDVYVSVMNTQSNFGEKNYDAKDIFDVCVKMVKKSKTGSYHKGNRNKFIFVLSCLLCEYGVYDSLAFDLISDRYPSLKMKEIKTTIGSAYKRCKHTFGTKQLNTKHNPNQQKLL